MPDSRDLRPRAIRTSRYSARDGAIIGVNQPRLFNRPIYLAHTDAFVLAGDRPVIRFASGSTLHGTLWFGFTRGKDSSWLHEWPDVTMEYRAAHVRWTARKSGAQVVLDVVGRENEVAFAVRATVTGGRRGDKLCWAFGGARHFPGRHLNWDLDPYCDPPHLSAWFDPASCEGNVAKISAGIFSLSSATTADHSVVGGCDASQAVFIRDALKNSSPAALVASHSKRRPVVCGSIDATRTASAHWEFRRVVRSRAKPRSLAPAGAFAAGLARSIALQRVIEIDTPDARLNAAVATLPAAIDGLWYPPTFRHGAMLWNVPYVGWRTAWGGTALGWHDRVKAHAEYYLGHQEKNSTRRSMEADPKVMLTIPAPDSRFYGRGRITQDQGIYNMQSQLFDQLIHAWHWTGDGALEKRLRPALELHLEWLHACFDPDGDGLFESVINVWPTDSVWFAGGGATEETSYAYRAHRAARLLAERAGDHSRARRHARQAARIRRAFHQELWVKSKGRAGLYRERDGLRRLHDDPWLYSVFLPIDAGLVNRDEAAQSLLFTERGLQNDRMPCGGRRVWTSNFVPAIWSVRELWPGDNFHLALSYFQTGLGEEGWDIFRGTLLHSAFDNIVPGDWADRAGGTDFGDSVHMGARALVEGLFGIVPDRPNGVVRVMPQFPDDWKHASVRTSDFSLQWKRRGGRTSLALELATPSAMEIRVPVSARGIAAVTVNGNPSRYELSPGYGRTWVSVKIKETTQAKIEVVAGRPTSIRAASTIHGKTGGTVILRGGDAKLLSFSDPEGAVTGAKMRGGVLKARFGANVGDHSVFATAVRGTMPLTMRFHLSISDPDAQRAVAAQRSIRVSRRSAWECVDLSSLLNGDIRAIYSQKYLAPRPPTMSAQIGTDGYSPWTFPYWDSHPPVIKLDGVAAMMKDGRMRTPQGVPFAWGDGERNIAFTSRWDNWPRRVTVAVNRAADGIFFLVGGSTNPMQARIANAALRLRYERGNDEILELVPPFNYWNLSAIRPNVTAPMQFSRHDYTSEIDAFCVPKPWPETVQLGENCRALLLSWKLRKGVVLKSVTLETLSADVVVGLMGVTLVNPSGRRATMRLHRVHFEQKRL